MQPVNTLPHCWLMCRTVNAVHAKGQSVVASRAIAAATVSGSWVLLQNCHLGLDYMDTMEDYLQVRLTALFSPIP